MNARAEAALSGAKSGRGGVWFWILIVLSLIGAGSLVFALSSESARPDLPLLTVNYLYLMGISQAGVVFTAVMRLSGGHWAKPYFRLAELSTLAFFPFAIAGFLLLYFYAQGDLFYWLAPDEGAHLSPWLSIEWLLIRNLLGLLLFYSLATAYILKALRPDLVSPASVDQRIVERELRTMSSYVLVAYVVCNTLISWDFGMMLIEHWHSTVFPIHFTFGNVFAGAAALLIFPVLLGRERFGANQIRNLGMLMTAFTLMWLYFYWAQFFVVWFGNLPRETDALWPQMYGYYGPYYWTMMAGCFFVPFAAFIFAFVKRSLFTMCLIAIGINLGIWINKYLTVITAVSDNHTPFTSLLDVALFVGLAAAFMAVLMSLARRWPMYSQWEIDLEP